MLSNDQHLKLLVQSHLRGDLAQSFIIEGQYGVGKRDLAYQLAHQLLLIPSQKALESYPDFLKIDLIDNLKKISLEQIHQVQHFVSKSPLIGQKKMVIINHADFISIEGQNALLKTIEEPSPTSIIILISAYGKLLPTLYSRCQVVKLTEAKDQKLEQINPQDMNLIFNIKQLSFFELSEQVTEIAVAPISDLELCINGWFTALRIITLEKLGLIDYTWDIEVQKQIASFSYKQLFDGMNRLDELRNDILFSNVKKSLALESFLFSF